MNFGQMVITSELGGCALQPAAALAPLHLGLVTSGGYNPELRGEYFAGHNHCMPNDAVRTGLTLD